ncbi:MAG: phosphonoacetaldehyde reductase [Clostridia bacterium]|nr:phosphonoacetaldehyde reductase [Clostridia bacterium]
MASMSYNALPHDADAWETEAQRLSMHRPLVVTSRRWQHLFQTAKNLSPVFFDSFHPNPDYTDCSLGYEVYQREHCDGLIACGGGSAMDTAKGIKALALSETPVHALRGEFLSDRPVPPFLAIPTTAGSGSEATPNAVLYKEGNKCSLSHPLLTPDQAIWDARLLNSLPNLQKKSCALDALCQGIESFWCRAATKESRAHAERAILGVLHHIDTYLEEKPETFPGAAEQMMEASRESGLAIAITRTTAPHAMSYMLTKFLNIPHGCACALTLPYVWEHMTHSDDPYVQKALSDLSSLLHTEVQDGPRLFLGLLDHLRVLPGLSVPDDTLDALADSVNVERLQNHPETLTQEEIRKIYRQALFPVDPELLACARKVWSNATV